MPRGKTPSLIGSSLGRPVAKVAGRSCACSRCKGNIAMGSKCYDVPQPLKTFSATRRFCTDCFALVLEQSRRDLDDVSKL